MNQHQQQVNSFMIASIVLGVFSLSSSAFIVGAFFAGGMSLLFAILSKGKEKKLNFLAGIGVGLSVTAMLLSIVLTVSVFYLTIKSPAYHELLNNTYKSIYGETFDDALERLSDMYQGGEENDFSNQ